MKGIQDKYTSQLIWLDELTVSHIMAFSLAFETLIG